MGRKRAKNPDLEQILEVHRELRQAIDRLRSVLRQEMAVSEALPMLVELRRQLAAHFEHEERGGYFREAVRRQPRLLAQAELLKRQHGGFLTQLAELERLAEGAAMPPEQRRLRATFESFRLRFVEHEEGENQLFLEAFATDIGVGD